MRDRTNYRGLIAREAEFHESQRFVKQRLGTANSLVVEKDRKYEMHWSLWPSLFASSFLALSLIASRLDTDIATEQS